MSKLESAFSKALEEQKQNAPDGANAGDLSSSPGKPSPAMVSPRKGVTVTSRRQIAGMRQQKVFTEQELAEKRIIYPSMRDNKLLNIYRNIRTKLIAKGGKGNFTTLVTSVTPRGGTSLISANLAAVFAFDEGKTALLVDGHMQAPALNGLFGAGDNRGLADYLESEEMGVDQILQETGIPRLRFVPTGSRRENSTEYLTSSKMQEFLDELVERYPDRYPIIDAPSVLDSADARILIDLCDQVVLVIPYGQCTEAQIKAAVETIGSSKLAGVVLNQF